MLLPASLCSCFTDAIRYHYARCRAIISRYCCHWLLRMLFQADILIPLPRIDALFMFLRRFSAALPCWYADFSMLPICFDIIYAAAPLRFSTHAIIDYCRFRYYDIIAAPRHRYAMPPLARADVTLPPLRADIDYCHAVTPLFLFTLRVDADTDAYCRAASTCYRFHLYIAADADDTIMLITRHYRLRYAIMMSHVSCRDDAIYAMPIIAMRPPTFSFYFRCLPLSDITSYAAPFSPFIISDISLPLPLSHYYCHWYASAIRRYADVIYLRWCFIYLMLLPLITH